MKKLVHPSILLLLLTFGNIISAFSATTATTAAGAWTTAGNWNNGVPGGADIATVNTGNAMTGVGTLALTTGGHYTIKANLSGGTNLTVASGSTFEVEAGTSTFSGTGSISGTLIVRSGATLTINTSITFNAGAIILIESGGTLHTGGSFANNSTSGVQVDGLISAGGSVSNNGTIYGNGNVTSVGAMSDSGNMFGDSGGLCLGGCNGNQLCTTNTITASSPMCSGGSVSSIAGNGILLTIYQWQSSTTGADASYANISGATSQNYTPTAISTTTYYRRKVTTALGLGCVSNSAAIVAIVPTVSVSPATVSACADASSTVITATPSGGTSPYTYSWSPATNLSSTTAANPTASPTTTTTYTVSVHDNNNCGTTTATSVFTITALPVISQIPASIQSHYKLDGNALDALGVNNGTLQNAPTVTTDRFGNANSAYSFDGSSQYISTAVQYSNPSQFALSLWFQTTTSVGGRLIGFGDASTGTSGSRDRMAWMDNTGNLVFAVNPGGTSYEIVSPKSYNDGSWHHLVVMCSTTTLHGIHMYVDGVLVASNATALGGQNYSGYWRINYDGIGWTDSPSSNYFKGSIDDVMIFNAELGSAQITTLYNTPDGAGSNSPVCLGGSLNLTSTTLASASYSWSGPNSFTSFSQNPSITNMSSVNEGVYTVIVSKGGCNATAYTLAKIDYTLGTSITEIPSSGNIANYKFNGNANDATGTNQGSLQNAPLITSDRFGVSNAAYTFDGSSQYVSTSKSYVNPSNLSLSIWFKTNTTNGGKLIGFGNNQTGGSTNFDRHIYMDNTGKIYFGVNPSSGRVTINSTLAYNDNTWHLATATLSSTSGIVLYIDGTSVASNATPLGGENYTGYYKIGYDAIGATWPATPTNTFFNGALDDILIYSRALTSTEVQTLYNGPDGPGQNGPVCVGSTLTFSAPTVSGATYAWTGPGTLLPSASTQNPTMTYALANAGIYTLNVTAGGCISRAYTIVSSNANVGQWTGTINNNWQTAGNWCGGAVPSSTTDVIIPAVATLPTNTATANARNLTINASATLTNASTGILNVYGNFTNNGTFTDNSIYTSTGVVNFTGSSAQTITGATTFSNVTIANTSGGVALNSTATINGTLTLASGAFATNGNLNQNLYNGSIAGTGAGTVTGNIRFFKYIYGDRYHYLSSPIAGVNFTDWNDNVPLAGHLYSYDETQKDTSAKVGWTAVSSGTIGTMTGYALFFPSWYYETTVDVTGSYTHSSAGSIASGSLSNTKTTLPVVNAAADGWHLVGNPYPSTVDWSSAGVTKSGIDNAIYTWDGRTNRYVAYVSGVGNNGGTQYIGSMQGFFVKVSTAGGTGSLTLASTARVTSTLRDVWRTEGNEDKILRLTVANGADADETVIRFSDDATEQFDSQLDAYKLTNDSNVPSVFSVSAATDYSINSLPTNLTQKTIPLQLNVALNANYSWTADLSGFTNGESLVLEDRMLGTSQNLSDNPVYNVSLNTGNYAGRFYLQYVNSRQSTITANTLANSNSGIEIGALQQNVFLLFANQNSGTANIAVYDAVGKPIYQMENTTIDSGKINFSLPEVNTGVYVVKVQTALESKTQQIFVQK